MYGNHQTEGGQNMNIDDILKAFDEYLKKDKLKIVNPKREKEILETYRILKQIIDVYYEDSTLEIQYGALDLGDVFIRIVTPQFTTYEMKLFATAIQNADNIDIYPTADDRIKIDLLFRNAYYVSII